MEEFYELFFTYASDNRFTCCIKLSGTKLLELLLKYYNELAYIL